MSMEQGGVPGDAQSFESRFNSLVKLQTQIQHHLQTYQTQNQRQLEVLTANLTKLMPELDRNGTFVDNDDIQGFVQVPLLPQRHFNHDKDTPRAIEQDGYRYSDEQNSTNCEEVEKGIMLEQNMSSVELQPQQLLHSSFPGTPTVASPIVQHNSSDVTSFILEEGTSLRNEQVPYHQADQEIEEDSLDECVPPLLQPQLSGGRLCPQQLPFSDSIGISIMDSPTVQPISSNHVAVSRYLALYKAAESGNWARAKQLFDEDPGSLTAAITAESDTALIIAIDKKQWMFAEELIKLMPPDALQLQETEYGNTALHIAAIEGNKRIAEAIVNKHPNATQIRNKRDEVPLCTATISASRGQKETIEYLCNVTKDEEPSPFSGPDGASLLCDVIKANFYGNALFLFERYPRSIIEKTKNLQMWPLEAIANRPFAFRSGSKLKFWQHGIYSYISTPRHYRTMGDIENPSEYLAANRGIFAMFFSNILNYLIPRVPSIKELYAQKLEHEEAATLVKDMIAQLQKLTTKTRALSFFENSCALKTVIKNGTTEIVEECLSKFPDLMWIETNNQTLLQIAIEERNEKILTLICETSDEDDKNELLSRKDTNGNGVLHFAAKLASSTQLNFVSGAALQMQREMQFFKGIEKMVGKANRLVRNQDGNTAQFMFTKEHDKLRKDGEEWMKGTSSSCMVVAALIATVVFAAAFTVPGGNFSDGNDNKGIPIFLGKISFMVFAVADALALFSSVTSILMFLAILTSRYAEEDFLTSLPTKLIIGLGTLFFSIAATMVAFAATLSIVLGHRLPWILIPITLFGCVPVTLFALLQSPLLVEMVRSTYWPSNFRTR